MMARDKKLTSLLHRFLRDESGATAVEYCLVAAGVAGVVVFAVRNVGNNSSTIWFDKIANAF